MHPLAGRRVQAVQFRAEPTDTGILLHNDAASRVCIGLVALRPYKTRATGSACGVLFARSSSRCRQREQSARALPSRR